MLWPGPLRYLRRNASVRWVESWLGYCAPTATTTMDGKDDIALLKEGYDEMKAGVTKMK